MITISFFLFTDETVIGCICLLLKFHQFAVESNNNKPFSLGGIPRVFPEVENMDKPQVTHVEIKRKDRSKKT